MATGIRWGILGTGRIAHDFVTAISVVPQIQIAAVGSRNESSAQHFAQRHNIPRYYASYEQLVQDSSVDIIYVASPNTFHKEHTLLALNHNKAVLCEKTFTINAAEAEQVVDLATRKNLFLMEANWMPFWPLFIKMRQVISEGLIGEVEFLQANLGFKNNHELNPGLLDPKVGGGALLACGIYPVTLASFLFGDTPTSVTAQAKLNETTGIDETVSIILKYGDKKMASLSTSISNFLDSGATIYGTKGSIRMDQMHCCPTKLTVYVDGEEPIVYEEPLPTKEPDAVFNFPNSEGLVYEALHVMELVTQAKVESDVMPHSKTVANMRTMDTIRQQIGLELPTH